MCPIHIHILLCVCSYSKYLADTAQKFNFQLKRYNDKHGEGELPIQIGNRLLKKAIEKRLLTGEGMLTWPGLEPLRATDTDTLEKCESSPPLSSLFFSLLLYSLLEMRKH